MSIQLSVCVYIVVLVPSSTAMMTRTKVTVDAGREAEEMRRRTNLPYRQGFLLFGCIGIGHRSYGAVHGLARGLNAAAAVSSRS